MDLLNPHCFSQQDLITILSERHLNISNLTKKSFSELLELYYNFVLPLHQRNSNKKDETPNGTSKNGIIKLNIGSSSSNNRPKNNNCDNKDIQKCNENGYKHKRIEFSNDAASVDSGGRLKRLKIMPANRNESVESPTRVVLKRPAGNTIDSPPKHKKITWP